MGKLQIVGLGPGDAGLITVSALQCMKQTDTLLLRTKIHPTVAFLDEEHIPYEALDRFYEREHSFEEVYQHIVDYVLDKTRNGDVVYAVPGSPVVAEATVTMLVQQGAQAGLEVAVLPGMSFLEVLYTRLHMDPVHGMLIMDSLDLKHLPLVLDTPVIITQVYDRRIASDVKLALMEQYGDEYEAILVYHVSLPDERIQKIPLYELDRIEDIDHLTSLVLPLPPHEAVDPVSFSPLVEVMASLRGEQGCPWDKLQTHSTLRRYLLEEVYEMLDAIDTRDIEGLREELGDILFQIVFHSRLAEEKGYFTAQDVIDDVSNKMIRRHPHVFRQQVLENIAESMVNWDVLKQEEKRQQHAHILDGVVKGLPSLLQAYKLLEKAAKVGFEWEDDSQVWDKVTEEWQEFMEALHEHDEDHLEEEAGDVLFVLANLFRRYQIEPECALRRANSKFRRRFSFVEDKIRESHLDWGHVTMDMIALFWQEAKEKTADHQLKRN